MEKVSQIVFRHRKCLSSISPPANFHETTDAKSVCRFNGAFEEGSKEVCEEVRATDFPSEIINFVRATSTSLAEIEKVAIRVSKNGPRKNNYIVWGCDCIDWKVEKVKQDPN